MSEYTFSEELSQKQLVERGEFEVLDNLDPDLYSPLHRGLLDHLPPHNLNKDSIAALVVAGPSLSGKTTLLAQELERIKTQEEVMKWERDNGQMPLYYLDTGMVIRFASQTNMIQHQQGEIEDKEYEIVSEVSEELGNLTMEYLPGPALASFEFVLVTAFPEEEHILGVQRGSLRFVKRLISGYSGRLVVVHTSEGQMDKMGEVREQARNATPEEAARISRAAGVVHRVEDPSSIQDLYLLSSNKKTRIQQVNNITEITRNLIQSGKIFTSRGAFASLEEFRQYYLIDNRLEWETLAGQYYRYWQSHMFGKPFGQISLEYGSVMFNHSLEESEEVGVDETKEKVARHVYDDLLQQSNMINALINQERKIKSRSLSSRLRNLGFRVTP